MSSALTYRSSTSEVRLVFFPSDEQNHPIRDLKQDDFAIIDDDMVIRQFRSFTSAEPLKLDLVVLIDASESVQPHFKQEVTQVLQLLSQWPWGLADKLSVASFSGTAVNVICSGDCRGTLLSDRIGAVPRGGATPLFDALDEAAGMLAERKRIDVAPVIILLSDGDDTISRTAPQVAHESILASEAQIYAIDIRAGDPTQGATMLQALAADSGGRYVRPNKDGMKVLNQVMNDVVEDLHSARVVTYALPPADSDFHTVRILPTRNLGWKFRSRRGYYSHVESGQ